MRKLGILGGMGPRATVEFLKDIYDNTEAKKDWDHIHIIVDSDVTIPSRARAILYGEKSPVAGMKKACRGLVDMGCDYIAVPCNSAHYFYDEVMEGENFPWINMLDVVSKKLQHYEEVLILGAYTTITKRTYDKYMDNSVYLCNNDLVYDLIECIKQGLNYDFALQGVYSILNNLDVSCVLLACTELSIAMKERICIAEDKAGNNKIYNLVDGNRIYIEEIIERCGANVKR